MNELPPAPASAPSAGSTGRVANPRRRRPAALVGLYSLRLGELPGVRIARILGILIMVGFCCTMLVLSTRSDRSAQTLLAIEALAWLSWLAAGLAALSVAQDLRARDDRDGITILLRQHGHDSRARQRALSLASIHVIVRTALIPALGVCAVALVLATSFGAAAVRALQSLGALCYLVLLGVVLGAFARWCAAISPRHGRSLLLGLVIGPHLARSVWPTVPSVPALFGALLGHLQRLSDLVA